MDKDKLISFHQEVLKAYGALDEAVEYYQFFSDNPQEMFCQKNVCATSDHGQDRRCLLTMHRDSMIKRFEFCYEMTWKYLKSFLRDIHGVDEKSPKSVFRACRELNLFDSKVVEQLLNIADLRNQTSHIYAEEIADLASCEIAKHSKLFGEIIQITKVN